MTTDKKIFVILLSTLAFASNLITIYGFIDTATFREAWSFRWMMSIFLIFIFFVIGFALILMVADEAVAKTILFVYSFIYGIAASIFYFYWGYGQATITLDLNQYSGYMVLFAVTIIASTAGVNYVKREVVRFISYFMGVANLLFLLILVDKYVFHAEMLSKVGVLEFTITYSSYLFQWDTFLGEMIILIAGAVSFIVLLHFEEIYEKFEYKS